MKHQRGVNKFEFAIAVSILAVLATVLLVRLNAMQAEAERMEVDLTVRNIRTGMQVAIGERIMHGQENRIVEVAEANPLDFLGERPRGVNDARVAAAPGHWAYDPVRRELSYLPRSPEAFADARELRWRYLARVDSSGSTIGVSLVALQPQR